MEKIFSVFWSSWIVYTFKTMEPLGVIANLIVVINVMVTKILECVMCTTVID